MLYDSLHTRLMTLEDSVEVYPAHGAGSACGRNISKETSSTIGEQRRFNYALRPMPKDEFVRMTTTDLPDAPNYFPMDAEINRRGAKPLATLKLTVLSPGEARELVQHGAIVLDVRDSAAFGAAHIPSSVNIGLDGQYATWAGSLLDAVQPLVIVADGLPQVEQAVMRLARVGFENVAGYIDGGIRAWDAAGLELSKMPQLPVDELHARLGEQQILQVLDVRTPAEFGTGHIPSAVSAPLSQLAKAIAAIERRPTAVICAGGYRSSAASSLLKRSGFGELYNVIGGISAWVRAGYTTER